MSYLDILVQEAYTNSRKSVHFLALSQLSFFRLPGCASVFWGALMRTALVSSSMLVLCFAYGQAADQFSTVESQRALVDKYCVVCHNDETKSGGFSWTKLDLAQPGQSTEPLEKVIRKLHAGLMPPAGMPRPDPASIKGFVTALETGIDQAAATHPNPGRPALHRLNRT